MKSVIQSVRDFIKQTDVYLLMLCIFASVFGLVMVMSATRYSLGEDERISREFLIMAIAVGMGLVFSLIISALDYRVFTKLWPAIAVVSIVLMLVLFKFGTGPSARSDVHTWLKFGPVNFQPSELVKIGFIITFSVHLEILRNKLNKIFSIVQLGVHALIPAGLVAVTGDMGSSLVFLVIAGVMLFAAGVHWGYFIGIFAVIAAASPLIWIYVLKQLQRDRFLALFYPDLYPDIIYQQKYGLNAIGAGGFTGQGIFKGQYTQAGLIPEGQNDMIFSVIGEETGFIGCAVALLLLVLIIIRVITVGKKSQETSTKLICCGIAGMLAGQLVINIGMCLMVMPVVGITLPFYSAGGSANLCVYLGIGLVLSIYRHNCEQETVNIKIYDSLL
ncbi:MAG TPA: rod shape-determining protein RodA [Ruminococcaceae bacterium]|nr:rod shape-determining protein RodA [Oscillospiraceae bacterium]